MIVAINIKSEYGKQGTLGINLMPELSDDGGMAYAHSMEQATAWVKSHAAFADVEPEDFRDGRFMFSSKWIEKNDTLGILFGYNEATHTRQTIGLYPVNTIFESTGYKPAAVYSLE